jgi:GxxExxY protein
MLHQDLTEIVIASAIEVSKELGTGFLESVYEKSLQVVLLQKGLGIELQVPLAVTFRGVTVGNFYADMIVDEKVLVELKAVTRILGEHKAQVINYLKATNIDVGLLINFGTPRIEYFRLHK